MTRVADAKGVIKVCERMDTNIKEMNDRIDQHLQEGKRLEEKVNALVDRIAFLEEANIKKEGRITLGIRAQIPTGHIVNTLRA